MKAQGIDSRESWVMVVACGIIFLLTSLPVRLSGQLFVSIFDSYSISRKAALLPFILSYFAKSVAGPLAGYFGKKFGLEKITLIGCVLCALGTGGCYFAEDIIAVDVFLGVIYGIGTGWATSLIPEIMNEHFALHRAKAFGFVLTGNAIGGFAVAPLLELTLNNYGLAGSFMILGGILLNGLPASMLLHKPRLPRSKLDQDDNLSQIETQTETNQEALFKGTREKPVLPEKSFNATLDINSLRTYSNDKCFDSNGENLKHSSNGNISSPPIIINVSSNIVPNVTNSTFLRLSVPTESKIYISQCEQTYLKSTPKLTVFRKIDSRESITNYFNVNGIKANDLTSEQSNKDKSSYGSFDIFCSPLFIVIAFIQSSHFYVMYMWWMIIVDVVRDKHVEEHQEVYFVVGLAIFDTVGRCTLGYLTDGGYLSRSNFSALCFFSMTLTSVLMPWSENLFVLMVIVCAFGFMSGGNTTGLPGIINQFIDQDKRTMAMASRSFLYAPMSLTISPLVGHFRGELGSYDGVFYTSTILCGVSAMALLIMPLVVKVKKNEESH